MEEKKMNAASNVKTKGKFTGWFKKYASSDVVIVGAGPSGLMAALDLAKLDLKILVIESSSYAGGRLWVNDFLIHATAFMPKVREILDELKIPHKKGKEGLSVTGGPSASSKLISAVCDAGVKILNLAEFEDLVYINNKIEGIVMNWKPQLSLKDSLDTSIPVTLNCQVVVDASGPGSCVCQNLKNRGVINPDKYENMDIRLAEKFLLEKSAEIYPGLAATGMALATLYGIPEGGLTLCSMLLSGRKVADEVEMFFAENYIMPFKKHR